LLFRLYQREFLTKRNIFSKNCVPRRILYCWNRLKCVVYMNVPEALYPARSVSPRILNNNAIVQLHKSVFEFRSRTEKSILLIVFFVVSFFYLIVRWVFRVMVVYRYRIIRTQPNESRSIRRRRRSMAAGQAHRLRWRKWSWWWWYEPGRLNISGVHIYTYKIPSIIYQSGR